MVPICTMTAQSKASPIHSIAVGGFLLRERKSFSMRTNLPRDMSTVTLAVWSQAHPINKSLSLSTTPVRYICRVPLILPSTGNEKYDIRIRNLASESQEDFDVIQECGSSVEWGNDDSTIFYTKLDEELRPFQIWLHTIGFPTHSSPHL